MEFKDRIVAITGASSGIGLRLARVLTDRGAKVALLARRGDLLAEETAKLRAAGKAAIAVAVDIGDAVAVRRAFEEVGREFGRLDALVNNAGVGYFGTVAGISPQDLERLVRTNVYGPIFALQAALPFLRESRGLVCNVSSGLSKRTLPLLAPYAGTKSMLDALSDGMRMELHRYGIRVVTYCAPETETGFDQSTLRGEDVVAPALRRRRQAPERVAARIADAMARERREVVENRMLALLAGLAPGLLDRMFAPMVERYAKD